MKCRMEISAISDSMCDMEENNYNNIIDPVKTGKFIRKLREKHNLTQEELGDKVFVTRKAVSKWETGRSCPSIDTLKNLSEVLGVSFDELLAGEFLEIPNDERSPVWRIVHSKEFKMTGAATLILIFLLLAGFFIYNYNATRVYNINYEDDNFSISNGVIVLSNSKHYFNIGNYYSNIPNTDEATCYDLDLYIKNSDGSSTVLVQSTLGLAYNEKKVSNEVVTSSIKDNIDNLYLKVRFIDNDNEQREYDLKLEVKMNFMNNFKYYIDKEYRNNGIENVVEKTSIKESRFTPTYTDYQKLDEVNIKFLYKLDEDELYNKLNNKNLTVGKDNFKMNYDKSGMLSFMNDDVEIEVLLNQHKIYFITNDQAISISINSSLSIEFYEDNAEHYEIMKEIFDSLENKLA